MAKILVVDDEADLLEMMRMVLEQRGGHRVTLSADGPDALAKAAADPPDMAILDVMMPGMPGYEVCRQLRANPATASIPIVILSARAQPMDRSAAIDAGADDYITKPVMMGELLEKVDAMLATHAEASAVFAGLFGLTSLRGGVGVTTLAANLALAFAQAGEEIACLVDFSFSSGHVALQLGLRPEPTWAGLIESSATPPNEGAVETRLLRHSSGLHVLASPFVPVVNQAVSREAVQRVLSILQQRFPVVVVDMPSTLNEVAMGVVEAGTVVGLVLTPEPPSLQTTVGTLRALQQWSSKLHMIINQVTPGAQLPAEAITRPLKRTPAGIIPFDPAQARALAQGAPLTISSPDSPLAQGVLKLAGTLVNPSLATGG
jgi:pilus assembly protein CpaE